MGLKGSFATAAALIICPIVALLGYKRWLDTRTFQPLDMPISLSPGHVKTPNFYINLTSEYRAMVDVDYSATYATGCQEDAWRSLKTKTTAFENGANIGEADGPVYGDVAVITVDKKGLYSLDLNVLSDASCLNSAHPTLTVSIASDFPYDDLYRTGVWIVLIPVVAGIGLLGYLLLARTKRTINTRSEVEGEEPRTTSVVEPRPLEETQRFAALPHFGLYCTTVLGLVVFVMMVLNTPYPSKGLYVSLNVDPNARYDPTPPIIVTIRQDPATLYPNLFVNSKPVRWSGLQDALKNELKVRPNWVIYIDGDPNLPFAHVAEVVNAAKELHAKAVLLTPESSGLLKRDSVSKPKRQH